MFSNNLLLRELVGCLEVKGLELFIGWLRRTPKIRNWKSPLEPWRISGLVRVVVGLLLVADRNVNTLGSLGGLFSFPFPPCAFLDPSLVAAVGSGGLNQLAFLEASSSSPLLESSWLLAAFVAAAGGDFFFGRLSFVEASIGLSLLESSFLFEAFVAAAERDFFFRLAE